jgi:hypothetical protein
MRWGRVEGRWMPLQVKIQGVKNEGVVNAREVRNSTKSGAREVMIRHINNTHDPF